MKCQEDPDVVEQSLQHSVVAQRVVALGGDSPAVGTLSNNVAATKKTKKYDEWDSSDDEMHREDDDDETEPPPVEPIQEVEILADDIRDDLHYCIFGPMTKDLMQPAGVADVIGSCVPGFVKQSVLSSSSSSSSSSSFSFGRGACKHQYPNIIAMLDMVVELIRPVQNKINVLRSVVASSAGSGNSSGSDGGSDGGRKRSRISQKLYNQAKETLNGIGHHLLWMCYSVTSGIVVHGNWYENYDRVGKSDGGGDSEDVKCLKEIGELLSKIWKNGVLSCTNEELRIDDDDRDDICWWLNGVQKMFQEMTKHQGVKGGDDAPRYDLSFDYDPRQ
jgi:hypothetical protein